MTITLPKGEEKKIKLSGGLDVNYLVAPVPAGTKVGSLTLNEDDRTLLSLPVETKGVERGGLLRVLWANSSSSFIGSDTDQLAIRAAIGKIPFFGPRLVGD